MALTITLIVFYLISLGVIDKFFRYSRSENNRTLYKSYTITNILKISINKTSLFSLIISLLRFNSILYLMISILLGNLFGSDIKIYEIIFILTYLLLSEFLVFLKTKKKSEINEVSMFIMIMILTLVCIGVTKESLNIGISTKVEWLGVNVFLSGWEIFNIPFLLIPIIYILVFSYTRLLESYRQINIKTADRLFDFLSEGFLYIYLVTLFIKTVFGGLEDLSLTGYDFVLPYFKIINLTIKFLIISIVVRLLIRFMPTQNNKKRSKNINLTVALLLVINMCFVLYVRNLH